MAGAKDLGDAMNPPCNAPPGLTALLRHAIRWLNFEVLCRRAAIATAVGAAAMLSAVVLDAVSGLPINLLLGLTLALVGTAVVLCLWTMVALWLHRNARTTTVLIERRLSLSENPLINALDLSTAAEAQRIGQSNELRERAVMLGDQIACGVNARDIVDRTSLRRSVAIVLFTGAASLLSLWLLADVYRAVLPRLLNPWADHPPYTPLAFDVKFTPETVHVGDPIRVDVHITGSTFTPVPHEADATLIEPNGVCRNVPLTHTYTTNNTAGSRIFTLRLERAEGAMQFYVVTSAGRSPTYTLPLLPNPVDLTSPHTPTTPNSPMTKGLAPDNHWQAWMDAVVETAVERESLLDDLRRLMKQIDHATETDNSVTTNMLTRLRDRTAKYRQRVEDLIRTGQALTPPPVSADSANHPTQTPEREQARLAAQILRQLTEQRAAAEQLLKALRQAADACQVCGQTSHSTAEHPGKKGSGQSTGIGGGTGLGGVGYEIARFEAEGWFDAAEESIAPTTPQQILVERVEQKTITPRSGGGALLGVPPAYREATEAYFRRLAEDAQPKP